MAEFMFLSVSLRLAGRKLPSLGVHRSVNGLMGIFLGVSWIINNYGGGVYKMSMIFPSSPTLLWKLFWPGFASKSYNLKGICAIVGRLATFWWTTYQELFFFFNQIRVVPLGTCLVDPLPNPSLPPNPFWVLYLPPDDSWMDPESTGIFLNPPVS